MLAEERPRSYALVGLVMILLVTCIVYWPAMHGDALWDDDAHLTRPELQSLNGLYRIWFEPGATQQYYPLLHSAFWFESKLWGDSVCGYHLISLFWHLVSVLLVYAILSKLKIPGALFAAAIFALHPAMVESVAWISEQKNTLSAVFYLSALLVYLEFDESRRGTTYALSLALFVLALLTKTVTATLPAALLLIFWWKRGRLSWKSDLRPLVPFFLLGAIGGTITAWVERTLVGAHGAEYDLAILQRGLLAGRVVWFYLAKLFVPTDLIFIYPRWTIDPRQWWQWVFPLAAIVVLVSLWIVRRKWRGPLAGVLYFCGTLVPALGFVNVYPFRYSYVADHFQYLASLGIIVLAAGGAARLVAIAPLKIRPLAFTYCAAMVALLAVLTWYQAHLYSDPFTLYQATLERNPGSSLIHNNLGVIYGDHDEPDEALAQFKTALALNSRNAEAHNNLAIAVSRRGQLEEAIEHSRAAVSLDTDNAGFLNTLAMVLVRNGRFAEASEYAKRSLQRRPENAEAHYNLAKALAGIHDTAGALAHFGEAVRIRPDAAVIHNEFGELLLQTEQPQRALEEFAATLYLDQSTVSAYLGLAQSLRRLNRLSEAYEVAERGIKAAKANGREADAKPIEEWLQHNRAKQ